MTGCFWLVDRSEGCYALPIYFINLPAKFNLHVAAIHTVAECLEVHCAVQHLSQMS